MSPRKTAPHPGHGDLDSPAITGDVAPEVRERVD